MPRLLPDILDGCQCMVNAVVDVELIARVAIGIIRHRLQSLADDLFIGHGEWFSLSLEHMLLSSDKQLTANTYGSIP